MLVYNFGLDLGAVHLDKCDGVTVSEKNLKASEESAFVYSSELLIS
jgi:hypothetical protein